MRIYQIFLKLLKLSNVIHIMITTFKMVKIVDTKSYVNESKRTIVTVIEDEIGNEFRGQSYCSIDDEFDKDFGEKLAYLRAKRKMIRYYRGIYEHNLKNAREQMK